MSIKLDMIPVSKDWDGWLVVSERRPRGEGSGGFRDDVPPPTDDDLPF